MALRALSTAATGMQAQQVNVDVIANNIANASTTGYKKTTAHFEDLLYQQLRRAGAPVGQGQDPVGINVGTGVRLVSTPKMFAQGSPEVTHNDLDLMVDGEGFFQVTVLEVQAPNQIAYSRNGSFTIDRDRRIVTQDGYVLEPNINVPEDVVRITVAPNGTILGFRDDQADADILGQIQLARFLNNGGLRAIGDTLFIESAASGPPTQGAPGDIGFGIVRRGTLEESNVDIVREIVDLITAQRTYEFNANTIRASDEMLQTANNLRA